VQAFLNFELHPVVWRMLAGHKLTLADLFDIDAAAARFLKAR
jgi:hypothetical protein